LNWQPPEVSSENGAPSTKPTEPTKPIDSEVVENGDLATKPTKPSKPGDADVIGNGHVTTKPTKPSKPADTEIAGNGHVTTKPSEPTKPADGQRPTAVRTVDSWYGGRKSRMTIARHNLGGANRLGQSAEQYAYCLIDFAAWTECPFDLRVARWFRDREEATNYASGLAEPVANEVTTSKRWSAQFADGVRVELRLEVGRWLMWVVQGGDLQRRKDFASPFLEHSQRTAEHWFGPALSGWSPSGLDEAQASD
jgi:hypothetical protein